jgi:hypothetical protein
MAKFNKYWIEAKREDGVTICRTQCMALSLESAWHKAVSFAFAMIEDGTGDRPETISVYRVRSPSESHG